MGRSLSETESRSDTIHGRERPECPNDPEPERIGRDTLKQGGHIGIAAFLRPGKRAGKAAQVRQVWTDPRR